MPASVQQQVRHPRNGKAAQPGRSLGLWRPLIDAIAAGAVFALLSTMLVAPVKAGTYSAGFAGIHQSVSASPVAMKALAEPGPPPVVEIATAASPADPVYRGTSTTAAWGLLGVAFSLLAALDLAILRHVKRVYAPRLVPVRSRDRFIGRCGGTRS